METWAWFAIAVGVGVLVGVEVWAWLRHGMSAVALAFAGGLMLVQGAVIAAIVATIGLGLVAGVSGWDPAGLNEGSSGAAVESGGSCDPSYPDACLDPDAPDYDCEAGSGDGPEYVAGPVEVTGDDPYDLDRDGDGIGCD